MWSLLGHREIEELLDLPLMSNPESVATLDVLTNARTRHCSRMRICLPLHLSDGQSQPGARQHRCSCYAYVHLGAIAGPRLATIKAGFRFGRLGYDLVERRGSGQVRGPDILVFRRLHSSRGRSICGLATL
jgi:hypothetical protein